MLAAIITSAKLASAAMPIASKRFSLKSKQIIEIKNGKTIQITGAVTLAPPDDLY